MSHEPDEALEVLRGIWSAQGHTSADFDDAGGAGKSCKRMAGVGFSELAGDDGLRAAWRARLDREGKRTPGASVADLVLGPAGPAEPGR
jgi:hypothetical protein